MSSPIFSFNKTAINAVSMGSDITSDVVDISEVSGFAAHCIFTGSPVGNIIVEGGNDGTNFSQVGSSTTASLDQYLLNAENQHYRYVRVRYVRTSGTGTLTVYISGKGK